MRQVIIGLMILLFVAGCSAGGKSVQHKLPDGSKQVDNFSSTAGDGFAPAATAVTTYHCPNGQGRECEVLNSAVVGGKSVVDQVGSIVAPIGAAAVFGIGMPHQPADNSVVNSSANGGAGGAATGGAATGGAGGAATSTSSGAAPPAGPL